MDFEAAGLLDGLDGEEREARRRLLERLAADGATLDELKDAVAEERLVLLPVERVLGGRYTARDIEEKTGVPAALQLRVRHLVGLPAAGPDDPVFSDEDVEAATSLKAFLDAGFSEQALGQMTVVLGEMMARLAATTAGNFAETFLKPGEREDEIAARFTTLTEQLTPTLTPVLVATFKSHLHEAVRRSVLSRAELEAGQIQFGQEVGVCFADLVGFTNLSVELEVEQLGSVITRLGELSADVAVDPVRLVKMIGDAAMFVSPEPPQLVDAALSLVEAAEQAELPAMRAGIAYGPAVIRSGDFYGKAVNLASRVTGVARPGSVLCTEEVRDASADEFDWSFAGKHRLKGVGSESLFRARRLGSGSEQADEKHSSSGRRGEGSKKPRADRRRRRGSR
ncbi:MAG TPA: adenylate cyclase regulatory domain-containing protein [Solirubrobacteraceae bacterium]